MNVEKPKRKGLAPLQRRMIDVIHDLTAEGMQDIKILVNWADMTRFASVMWEGSANEQQPPTPAGFCGIRIDYNYDSSVGAVEMQCEDPEVVTLLPF